MNNTALYSSLSFAAGAIIGGLITWGCVKKHYANYANAEIQSVKDRFTIPREEIEKKIEKKVDEKKPSETSKSALNKPSIVEYARKIKDSGYTNYSNTEPDSKKSGKYPWEKSKDEKDQPYVISPDDFADGVDERDDYDQVSLVYYADGILAYDEDDNVIENVDEIVGDALDHIGDYEDDAVHVCNPKLKIFYEILEDVRSYEDATHKKYRPDKED